MSLTGITIATEYETAMHHILSFNAGSQYTLVDNPPLYVSESNEWINQIELHGDDEKAANIVVTEYEFPQSDLSLDSIRQSMEGNINELGVGGVTFSTTTINGKPALTWHIPRQTVPRGFTFPDIYAYSYWYDDSTKVAVSVNGFGKTVYDNLLKLQIKEKT
jgi:hypothetical protein